MQIHNNIQRADENKEDYHDMKQVIVKGISLETCKTVMRYNSKISENGDGAKKLLQASPGEKTFSEPEKYWR